MTEIKGRFKKGISGNPLGRPKKIQLPVPEDIEILQELSRGFIETKIAAAMQRTVQELADVYKNPESQSIDVAISSIMLQSCKGNYKALNFLMDRVVGKTVEKIDIKTDKPFIIKSLGGETYQLGMRETKDGSHKSG